MIIPLVCEILFFFFGRPVSLEALLDIKAEHNDAKLIVGNTEVGIEMKFKSMAYPHLVGTTHVEELNAIEARFSPAWSHHSIVA